MKKHIRKLLNWVLPSCCELCHLATRGNCLCARCQNDFSKTKPSCEICQAGLALDGTCGECIKLQPSFDKVYTLGDYQGSLAKLITSLKFQGKLSCGRALSELWIKALPEFYPQKDFPSLIIPIPLHKKRLRERGFNQSLEIAKPIGKQFKIPVDKFSCLRIKATAPQLSLPQKERKKNLAHAFKIQKPINTKHVAIFDDVFTTGHTINTLAAELKQQGVQRIDVWCCARTQLRNLG